MNELICDKCGSKDIEQGIEMPESEIKVIKMTEFTGPPMISDLVYRPVHYKLTCKNCGFQHKFTN